MKWEEEAIEGPPYDPAMENLKSSHERSASGQNPGRAALEIAWRGPSERGNAPHPTSP